MAPRAAQTVRWGVLGPGAIATGFADAMTLVEGGSITAVASRSLDRATDFADRYQVPKRYGDYQSLLADSEVDVVYVATPQSRHAEDTIESLQAEKHVLCEKPFALNHGQAQRMIDVAQAKSRFLMEAIWSRFLPAYTSLIEVLADGTIGEPLFVEADFGFRREVDPDFRLFRLDLGGGSLLDLGIYPIQLCSLVLGPSEAVVADGTIGATGVDEFVAAVLRHSGDRLSVIKSSLRAPLSCSARIAGTDGVIEIPALMHCPESIRVASAAGIQLIDGSYEGNGLRFEIDEVHRCLESGQLESRLMPWSETLALASTLDSIRTAIGLKFPQESPAGDSP
jgi:predicted dehydrogenase